MPPRGAPGAAHTLRAARPGVRPGPGVLAQALAFSMPFLGALSQTRSSVLFRSDEALLAALDHQAGFQGALSAVLAQVTLALPLGNHVYRVALPGAFFAGIGGISLLHLCHALFRRQGGSSRLDPWLALGASLSAALSFPWMSEASVAGGAVVSAGLSLLLLLRLIQDGLPRSTVSALTTGALLGALLAESLWCGGLVAVTALILWPERGRFRSEKGSRARAPLIRLGWGLISAGVVAALLIAPAVLSQSTTVVQTWGALGPGRETSWIIWSPLDWISSIGFLWTLGAAFGLIFALPVRTQLFALALWMLIDFLAPGFAQQGWTNSPAVGSARLGLHLVALATVAPLGALGLRTLGETAQALRLFAAQPLSAMVAVLATAGCLASAEDSLRTLEETKTSGAQSWTEAALNDLPDDALILTKSRAPGLRLLAAQALGERPDVLIVPLSEVTRPETLRLWLTREPELEVLLRDLSTLDTPSERAITRLVDKRPVYLEADPTWDPRLLEHVLPGVPLCEFSPHALGRSDRLAALETVPATRDRIVRAYEEGLYRDAATEQVLLDGFLGAQKILEVIQDGPSRRTLEDLIPREAEPQPSEGKPLAPLAAL